MQTKSPSTPLNPWYKEPWPWLLMSGPLAVVVAGFVTLWLAIKHDDGLVKQDYYKQGLAINETLTRIEHAQQLGLKAEATLDGKGVLRLQLNRPEIRQVVLEAVHPTRAGLDQTRTLAQNPAGVFETRFDLAPGNWQFVVRDPAASWRINGTLRQGVVSFQSP